MRIATFNVNGIIGRLPVLVRWLADADPDVVCLQELKAASERSPETAIREAGYGAIWHGQKSWNGVAILARGAEPIETCRGLPGDADDTHSRYIEAAVNGCSSAASIFPTAIPRLGRSSILSCAGSNVWPPMQGSCWQRASRSFSPATTT